MNKVIEKLMKQRLPVHDKCRGIGFNDEEKINLRAPRCKFIEPLEIFEIIDEETGETDAESVPEVTINDEACRCSAYVNPNIWWDHPSKRCPLADHYRPDLMVKVVKGRTGQQKQKKRR